MIEWYLRGRKFYKKCKTYTFYKKNTAQKLENKENDKNGRSNNTSKKKNKIGF